MSPQQSTTGEEAEHVRRKRRDLHLMIGGTAVVMAAEVAFCVILGL
jgi:hypothetical protein